MVYFWSLTQQKQRNAQGDAADFVLTGASRGGAEPSPGHAGGKLSPGMAAVYAGHQHLCSVSDKGSQPRRQHEPDGSVNFYRSLHRGDGGLGACVRLVHALLSNAAYPRCPSMPLSSCTDRRIAGSRLAGVSRQAPRTQRSSQAATKRYPPSPRRRRM